MKKKIKYKKDICPVCKKKYIVRTYDQDMCDECLFDFADYITPKKKKLCNWYEY